MSANFPPTSVPQGVFAAGNYLAPFNYSMPCCVQNQDSFYGGTSDRMAFLFTLSMICPKTIIFLANDINPNKICTFRCSWVKTHIVR